MDFNQLYDWLSSNSVYFHQFEIWIFFGYQPYPKWWVKGHISNIVWYIYCKKKLYIIIKLSYTKQFSFAYRPFHKVEWVNWSLHVTFNDISVIYVTAHRCAGGLKNIDLRSGSHTMDISYGSLTGTPFLRFSVAFYDAHGDTEDLFSS